MSASETGESSAKKQRISLKLSAGKVNGNARGRSKSKSPGLQGVEEDEGMEVDEDAKPESVKEEEEPKGRMVPLVLRSALENIISK